MPEAGCVVLIDLPIEKRRWESLVNAFIFVIDAFMLLLTSWIAQGLDLGFRVDQFLAALLGASSALS